MLAAGYFQTSFLPFFVQTNLPNVAAFVLLPFLAQISPTFAVAALELKVPRVDSKRVEVTIATKDPTLNFLLYVSTSRIDGLPFRE